MAFHCLEPSHALCILVGIGRTVLDVHRIGFHRIHMYPILLDMPISPCLLLLLLLLTYLLVVQQVRMEFDLADLLSIYVI